MTAQVLAYFSLQIKILKLGYAFNYDARHMANSYGELNCLITSYQMLLDIRQVNKEQGGGLSVSKLWR